MAALVRYEAGIALSALAIAWRRGGSPRACARSSSFSAVSSAATSSGATPVGDLPPGINVLTRFAAADAKGPVIVEQHHEAGVSEGLGEPRDAVFPHGGV